MDRSLPDSSVHGIFQAKEYWSGVPLPSPGSFTGYVNWGDAFTCLHILIYTSSENFLLVVHGIVSRVN